MFDIDLAKYSENICLITKEKVFTYSEVDEICLKIQEHIPKEKNLIVVKAGLNIETIVGYLSLLRMNQAFIMLDSFIDKDLMKDIIDIYKPNFIWEKSNNENKYIFNYGSYGLRVNNHESINLYKDLSLMLSTSGTTGSPKLVRLTKKNIYKNCSSIIKYLNISSTHRTITNLPFYYSYGLSVLNTHLSQGASIVVTDKSIISKEFWEIFKEFKVTTINGVPYNYEILKRIGFMSMDLKSLKFITQAGGKLNHKYVEEYATWAKKRDIDFFIMYGQTEATARISYIPLDKTLKKKSSIGIAIADGKLSIKSLKNEQIVDETYVDGELVYQGENVMLGYGKKLEDLSKGDELKGVLYTGDIAYKDKDGYFFITGRLNRFIKIHGNRISLDEVEQFLKSKNHDLACTGIDNKLLIVTKEIDKVQNIKEDIIKKYAIHHSVIEVKYVEKYPLSGSGKIKYQELIKDFL